MLDINLISLEKETNILENKIELFFQEIAVLLDKGITDFYGVPYIVNLEKYIFSKYVTTSEVKYELVQYVKENCPSNYLCEWSVDVDYVKGKLDNDILYIRFNVNHDGEIYTNQYLIGQK